MENPSTCAALKQDCHGLPRLPFVTKTLIPLRASKLLNECFVPKLTTRSLQWKPELEICAVKRPDSAKASRVKDLPRKKPRDFAKTKAPLSLEPPAPQQVFETLDEEHMHLKSDQAIGHIVSAQANFMRVIVHKPGTGEIGFAANEGTVKERESNIVEQAFHLSMHKGEGLQDDEHVVSTNVGESSSEVKKADGMIFGDSEASDGEGKVGMELLCVVRALLKKIKKKVMVGDKVLVSGVDWIDGRGMIEQVFNRESEIWDPPVANVDQLLVLSSLDRPRPEPMSLSRFLVEAESTGIPFTIIFNKTDLVSPKEVSDWEKRLNSWGYKPLFCSAATKLGMSSLVDILANKTSVIIGSSGVGKSSVINALGDEAGVKSWSSCEDESTNPFNTDVVQSWSEGFEEQMVGEVSERSGRGKHTTRNVSLLRLPSGGYLADTPGFNQPGLVKVSTKSLPLLFPEIRSKILEVQCAFSDCFHTGEPNCVVGGDWERYAHYLQLLEELKKREQMEMKTFGTKRECEVRYKVKAFGVKQPEPRLVLKKHRRVSRQQGKQNLAVEFAEEVEEAPLRSGEVNKADS